MTSFQERFNESKVKKYIPLFVVGKLAIFTGFFIQDAGVNDDNTRKN